MVTVATISAPSSEEVSEWFNVSGIVYESITGNPISGAIVNIYYDGKSLGSATTGVDGDYLDSVRINEAGYFNLESIVGSARASRYITITEPEPEPQVITTVSISAPSSADKNVSFTISGTVKDQYGDGVAGASVALYDNGSHFATVSTNSAGGYSKSHSIISTGIHELAAVSGGKQAWTDITITTPGEPPEPEPEWELIEIYRGYAIYLWPSTDEWRGYYFAAEGKQWGPYTLSRCRTEIDKLVEPEPPVVTTVTISAPASVEKNVAFTVSGTVKDQFGVGMGGVSVFLFDNGSHFATVTTNSSGYYSKSTSISLARVHELAARANSKWAYKDITITEPEIGWELIEIYRGYAIYLWPSTDEWRGYYFAAEGKQWGPYSTVQGARSAIDGIVEPPVGIPTTTTISAPSKVAVNEKFNISGILYETESGIPIPNQPINHSYDGKGLGSSITGVEGDYLKEVSIPEANTWTLKSEFLGTEALQASRALVDAVVTATPIETALLIAGPTVTGIAFFIYGVS